MPGYRVVRLLARGGIGTVLAATREGDDLEVALKVAHADNPSAAVQLQRETEVLSTVGPPVVPALHVRGKLQNGSPYMVMELVSLPTLASRLENLEGPMELAEFTRHADAILSSLSTLHQRGWVHCNLKPENIFLGESSAKFCDFGLSLQIGQPDPVPDSSPVFAGTAEYMSPEQGDGKGLADVRVDTYAAGVILFEMLAGRPPFFGPAAEVHQAHQGRRPPRLSELAPASGELESVILRALSKEPDRRFPSAEALREAVSEALRGRTHVPVVTVPKPTQASARGIRRRPMGILFLHAQGASPQEVRDAVVAFGGELASTAAGRYAIVFDSKMADNPVRRAYFAGRAALERSLAVRAVIDLAPVTVQARPDGSARYFANFFTSDTRYPSGDGLPAMLITVPAAEVLSDQPPKPVPGLSQLFEPPDAVPREAGDPTVLRLSSAPIVGREDVLRLLVKDAREAIGNRAPTLATVISEPGYGKSHLAAEVGIRVRTRLGASSVMRVRAHEPLAGDVGDVYRTLLRLALDLPEVTPSDGGRAVLAGRLGKELAGQLWPAVALALGWVGAEDPEVHSLSAAPGAVHSAMTRALGEALRWRARQGGLALIIDDAHFADDAVLDAVEFAALSETNAPLWVCALARPSFATARAGWGQRAARRTRILLDPLSKEGAVQLCRLLLQPAENVPAKAVERLVERCHAIPFLMVELIRGLKRDGLVRQHAQDETWYLATEELDRLPELASVEWLANRELEALSPDLAAHARLLATLSPEFTSDEAEGVVRQLEKEGGAAEFPADARVGTRRLVELGLLLSHRHQLFSFRNSLVRDAAARAVPEALRKRIHLAAFRFYQSQSQLPETGRLPRLAFHAGASDQHREAAQLYLQLAERARIQHLYFESEGLYTHGLRHLEDGAPNAKLVAYRGRGLMRYRMGRYDDSLSDLARARELAQRLGDLESEIEILLDEATARDWIGDYHNSLKLAEDAEAKTAASSSKSAVVEARLLLAKARSNIRFKQWADAVGGLERAAQKAEPLGDAGYETLIVSVLMLAPVLAFLKRTEEARIQFERAIDICRQHGDRLHLAATINSRRYLWTAVKDVESAVRDQHQYIQLARELGLVGREINGEGNLGEILYQAGDLEAAWHHVRRAVELERRHPEAFPRPVQRILQGRLYAYEGNSAEARSTVEEIQRLLDKAAQEGRNSALPVPSERVLFNMVDLASREATGEEWEQLLERARKDSQDQELIEVVETRALSAIRAGDQETARRAFAEALETAQRIPNIMEERVRRQMNSLAS